MGLEGIIAKRRDSRYRSGRGGEWLKIKCVQSETFVIIGYEPSPVALGGLKDGEETIDLFAFLTTDPNAEVKPIHPNAMPVILTTPEECEAWMAAMSPPAAAGKKLFYGVGERLFQVSLPERLS